MAKKEAVIKISFRGEPYEKGKGEIPEWFREKATAFFEDLAKHVDVAKLSNRIVSETEPK